MMMSVLGADSRSHHDVANDLRHVEVVDEPASPGSGGGVRHVYRVGLADIGRERRGLVEDYLRCVEALLDAWSSNPVAVRVDEPSARKRPQIVRPAS